ncbi:MAG: class II aldolase/adducin family protein [Verrucomicrobia bacterium]|nr:class II aldolase/adducin family protein [Verrucomicrobiota bacterium]
MTFSLLHPRDQIVAIMARIYGHGMTTTSGGNISIRDENGDVWITPARVDKGSLRAADIVRISPDGSLEGNHPPSSEYPFHLSIYKARPDIDAIIHAHPCALVSFSICGQVPNTRIFPEAWNVCGKPGLAPYALPGSQKLGENIAAEFAAGEQPYCVILQNHGVVVGAEDLTVAYQRLESLEFAAETIINACVLGKVHYLGDEQIALSNQPRNILPEHPPEPATVRERELRKAICDFVHRSHAHRLMTSTKGSFSARIDAESFLITPYNVDRRDLDLADLVVVRNGTRAAGQTPSRAVGLHRAIYDAHPEIHAIVNALPVHAAAFCASESPFDTRTIPESYLFLKDVGTIPFEQQYGSLQTISSFIGPKNPVALLENNGVLVASRSVLDAFDRLEVLEATAAAILRSRSLGAVTPMSDAVIQELTEAFPSM